MSAARLAAAGAVLLSLVVAGCSSGPNGSTLSNLPVSMGGLPGDTPARPVSEGVYPAVHDMPPPRATPVMTAEQVKAAEAEISFARDRAKRQAGVPVDGK